jgi:hypothetical protein
MIKKRVAVSWKLLAIIVLSVTILASAFISFRVYNELRVMEDFLVDVCTVEEKCPEYENILENY